jgi:hypothetical protein
VDATTQRIQLVVRANYFVDTDLEGRLDAGKVWVWLAASALEVAAAVAR